VGIEILGFSTQAYALITTFGALLSVIASVAMGIFLDRTGRYRTALILCNIAGIIGACAVFLLPSKAIFILTHALLFPIGAMTFTQYFSIANLTATQNPTLDKDFSLALIRAAFAAAFGLTPPVLAIMVASGFDLIHVYGLAAGINTLVLLYLIKNWPRDLGSLGEKSDISFLTALTELGQFAVLLRVVLVSMVIGINALFNILLGLLIINHLDGSPANVGWFAGAVALIEAPVMLLAARVVQYYAKSLVIMLGCCLYCAFLAALAAMPNITLIWPLIIPGGIGAGIILSVTVGYVQELVISRPGAGSSLITVTHFFGTIFAAVVLSVGTAWGGYTTAAWTGCAISALAGILLFWADGCKIRATP
jgi:MFS family permease